MVLGRAYQPPQRRPMDLTCHHLATIWQEKTTRETSQAVERRPRQILERHDMAEESTRQGNLETACWGLRPTTGHNGCLMMMMMNIKTHIDREVLQSDLSRLEDWSRKWQLCFNADKCKVLHIGWDNEHYEYYMDRDTQIGARLWSANRPRPEVQPTCWDGDKQSKQDVRHDTTRVHVQGRRHHQYAIH